MTAYKVLYRGPLSSCNYGCHYCPFAKRSEKYDELADDRQSLENFCNWIESEIQHQFEILITPWGEALVRRWYQEAMIRCSHLVNVDRIACQTNLSFSLDWIRRANLERLAFWTTFHPTETTLDRFVDRVMQLRKWGVRLSVGVVGLKEQFDDIKQLRSALPIDIYVWVNAYKREPEYYQFQDEALLSSIDPHFQLNNTRHASLGQECFAGESSFTVDGNGNIRRCHFIDEPIGNIHAPNWDACLATRLCTNRTCGCHIGYVHLKPLKLYSLFREGVLERIPHNQR